MDATPRLPVFAVSHGGGPWPWIKDDFLGDWGPLERSLRELPADLPATVRAIVCVSAHWSAPVFTVQTSPQPPMLYDYYGFPDHTYRIRYPAPGSPGLAERIVGLLADAGLPAGRDATRGFDHGAFVPLYVAWPEANVPVVQVSLQAGYDAAEHIALGRALAPLRDEGVLIVGSGMFSFHNLPRLGPASTVPSTALDRWITDSVVGYRGHERSERLARWTSAPHARECHPEPDHLLPLLVAVGAAEDEPAAVQFHEDTFMGWTAVSSYQLGAPVASSILSSAGIAEGSAG